MYKIVYLVCTIAVQGTPAKEETTLMEGGRPDLQDREGGRPDLQDREDSVDHSSLLSGGDSMDLTELSALAEAAHERVMGGGGGGGGGVARSASEEVVRSRVKRDGECVCVCVFTPVIMCAQ